MRSPTKPKRPACVVFSVKLSFSSRSPTPRRPRAIRRTRRTRGAARPQAAFKHLHRELSRLEGDIELLRGGGGLAGRGCRFLARRRALLSEGRKRDGQGGNRPDIQEEAHRAAGHDLVNHTIAGGNVFGLALATSIFASLLTFLETQGNVQVLPNGNVFVGWGSEPVYSEFDADGKLLFSAAFPTESESYRAFRLQWSGQPTDDPAMAVESGPEDEVTLYASWNGATEVTTWQVLAGSAPDQLEVLASAPRQGFETVITVHTTEPYVSLMAVNSSGKVLGTTNAIKPEVRT